MYKSLFYSVLWIILTVTLTGCSKDHNGISGEPVPDGDYYVSTSGNDANPGTFEEPWASLQKAISVAEAGDIIYIRGGTYFEEESIDWIPADNTGHDGTPDASIHFLNYPGERPVFDFINSNPSGNYSSGFYLNTADYIHLRGMTVRNVKQKRNYVECLGIYAYDCTNLKFENMTVNNVDGNAFRFFGAWRYPGTEPYMYPEHADYPADSTFFINCDAYDCCDRLPRNESNPPLGGAADGFKTTNEPGAYILFEGCRAWNCSDDGFDPSGTHTIVINHCWSFENGLLDGDGVGYKTGGVYNSDPVLRLVTNCVAAFNRSFGFFLLEYPDYERVNARFYNNTSYHNEYGFSFSRNESRPVVLGVWKNNIAYKNTSLDFSNAYAEYTESNNSWNLVGGYPGYVQASDATVSDADFVSLNADGLKAVRKADGSLPDMTFLKLAPQSDLINKGTEVGLTFLGTAPDLGAFEKE
jgi:hypothetical protein